LSLVSNRTFGNGFQRNPALHLSEDANAGAGARLASLLWWLGVPAINSCQALKIIEGAINMIKTIVIMKGEDLSSRLDLGSCMRK
jgi:hypothetical protein